MDDELQTSIQQLLTKAPQPVQNFVLESLGTFVISMMTEYALHLDQGDVLERELFLMLVGQENPSGFSKKLQESGIPAEDVRSIVTDVNEKVFKKLQASELQASPETTKPAYRSEPARAEVPVMQLGEQPAVISPTPAPSAMPAQPPHFNLIQPQAAAPVQSSPSQSTLTQPAPTIPTLAPVAQAYTAPAAPEMRTMASDMQAMQHPGIPHQPVHAAAPVTAQASISTSPSMASTMPSIPNPAHVSPARSFQTASVPFTSVPTASQPVIEARSMNAAPAGTSYSSDPYREPIE